MQALMVEQQIMNNTRFQSICYRQSADSASCTPAFSFASFIHAPLESYTTGNFDLQAECDPYT